VEFDACGRGYRGNKLTCRAVGKNKRLSKGKRGIKKKVVDPFTRKGEPFTVLATRPPLTSQSGTTSRLLPSLRTPKPERPSSTELRVCVSDHCQRKTGTPTDIPGNANDSLKGRVVELSLADLNNDQEQSFRKIKLRVEDISVSEQTYRAETQR